MNYSFYQEHLQTYFKNAIKMNKLAHAYIFEGEEGMGKLWYAKKFASALECDDNVKDDKTGICCGHCKSCRQIESGSYVDLKIITHEKASIGVDEIRDQIEDDIDIKPYNGRYKVYIIPDANLMTVQAQNALLKTIEEPPEYAVIMLLCTSSGAFLPTILSRCILLSLKPVKESIIRRDLKEQLGLSEYDASVYARFAEGNPKRAEKLATSKEFSDMKEAVISSVCMMSDASMEDILNATEKAMEFKDDLDEYFNLMRMWFRDLLYYMSTEDTEGLIFKNDYMHIEQQAKECDMHDVNLIIESIGKTKERIDRNVGKESAIELLYIIIRERLQR